MANTRRRSREQTQRAEQRANVGFGNYQAGLEKDVQPLADSLPGLVAGGFDRARGHLGNVAAGAQDRVLRREDQTRGGIQQSAMDRGLYTSSAFDSDILDLADDTNLALADIDRMVAQIGVGLEERSGTAEAGAVGTQMDFYSMLSAIPLQQAQSINQLWGNYMNVGLLSGGGAWEDFGANFAAQIPQIAAGGASMGLTAAGVGGFGV